MNYIRKYKIYKLLGADYITSDEKDIMCFVDNFLDKKLYVLTEEKESINTKKFNQYTFYYLEDGIFKYMYEIYLNRVNIRYDNFWKNIEKLYWKYPYINIKEFIMYLFKYLLI